ncbi:antirestriction family protein [Escherichia coli P0304816.13]|nr:antirestriction family protein [Escherichia coli P0304816.13]
MYALAKKMMPEYEGGFWHFIRLPDGGGYMMPDGDRFHMVNGANWFDRTVSADAAGIIVTSLVINRSCGCTTTAGMRTDHLPDARCAVVEPHRISPRM